jgi:thiosulfate reductase cytochrome b subunit
LPRHAVSSLDWKNHSGRAIDAFARRLQMIYIQRKTLFWFLIAPVVLTAAAYLQWAVAGLPSVPEHAIAPPAAPHGFPAWLRLTHYVNLLFMVLLVRSGLQILADHPRLYWNLHCTPGSEWARFTSVVVPIDRLWTSKDDARHLSPWIGLPGYRHTVGMARHWHFLSALFWLVNGVVFVSLLLSTPQWNRLVPTSWEIVPNAWKIFVHYATFHMPPEPDGYYRYNALQQLAYFGVTFVLAPLAILSGPSMSPALTNRFAWYPKLPGNRQVGRSLHFLVMCAFVMFALVHVAMVAFTGFARNMNHIVLDTDDPSLGGVWFGLAGLGLIVLINVLANWAAWRRPRAVQHAAKAIISPLMKLLFGGVEPCAQFKPQDISPYFWANGKLPTCDAWKTLAADGFKDYRLKVGGLVDNPVELSLGELRAMGGQTQITLHHCIQGWSGVAAWGGLPLAKLIELVRPDPAARSVVFYSFGEGGEGGQFYDSLSLENALYPQTLLAYDMNSAPLSDLHGAPLRLRVENQLGFKMVKWIESIEFAAEVKTIYQGEGGYNEDHEYFGEQANI